jgi:transcriptional regulator with XRE-family HTH domain
MINLGQRLHDQRLKKGLSLDDVTRETKIRPVFLTAIERGEYSKLPASSYAQGFVANYAEYLGFTRREALALFRREFDDAKAYSILPKRFANPAENTFSKFKIQYTTFLIMIAFFCLLIYLGYSYKDAFINPVLVVENPIENVIKSGEITIRGKTDPYHTVTVNNSPVYLSTDGSFFKTISAFPGKLSIVIKATNRFGKTTTVEKSVTLTGQ